MTIHQTNFTKRCAESGITGHSFSKPNIHIICLSLILSLSFFPAILSSQHFEGSVMVNQYRLNAENEKTDSRNLNLEVSKDRIRVNGLNRVDASGIMNNMGATDLLIRHDRQDFVFLTNDRKAIILGLNELQMMVNLMTGGRGQAPSQLPDMNISETGQKKDLNGYMAKKWIVEGNGQEIHVWASDDFSINWGMLAEPWVNNLSGLNILPVRDVLKNGNTPLLVESVRNGRIFEVIEVTNLRRVSGQQPSLEIPDGFQVMTFQEMMVNRMRGQ